MRKRTYSKTIRRGERGFNFAVLAIVLWFALWVMMVGAVFFVAGHFIIKYW